MKKRIISFILVLALCVSMVPFSAFAETLPDTPESTTTTLETDTSAEIPTEETEEPDGAEESPIPAENPEQGQEPTAPEESPTTVPAEGNVSEGETAGEPQPEPAPSADPESEYIPGFTVEVRGGKYAWPVPTSSDISQGYAVSQHEALDIAADEGSSVLAVETGTVSTVQLWGGVSTEGDQSYGNMVMISHKDGNTTLYAHLSEITVTEGQAVECGEEIGLVGATGNVTGPHLHFEVISQGGKVDPTDYITGGTEEPLDPETEIPVYRVNGPSTRFRMAGERGKLRILYNCFTSNVGYLPTIGDIAQLPAKAILTNGMYKAAYCLDEHLAAVNGQDYTWSSLAWDKKRLIGDILALGFHWENSSYWTAESASNYQWAVCQFLVWAVQNGNITRNSNGETVIPSTVDADVEKAAAHSYNPSGMKSYYYTLKNDLIKLRKIPSFAGRTPSETKPIKLSWNGTNYSATVTDSNGVLSRYDFKIAGIEISRNGNTLSIHAEADMAADGAKLSDRATYSYVCGEGAVAVWKSNNGQGGDGNQDFAIYDGNGATDPVPAYIKVSFDAVGSAGLRKISEDGDVAGKSFRITGSDGSSVTKTTDSSGRISLDGLPIYVASEDEESEEESSGERITYTATEVNVPIKYVAPSSQTFQLYEGQEASLEFENRLKKWRVIVTKTDRETGSTPQGDATLGGAVYGIYHNGILQDTYTTDSSGRFTTKYYVCGTGWTLKEITPSEGYLLNVETKSIGLSPYDTTIEYNSTSAGVKEQVIKGRVGITKHTDDGSTQIETPETGAKFQVYLSSAGSYENAKPSERDIITIGENGYGETKLMPYGLFTVHQFDGWEGKEKIPDFQVFISEDGKTYSFIINNRVFEALIQIVKKDSETGKVIPASGIGFKIKDLTSGKWVSQHINYPTPMDIDTFYTDVTGRLMLPAPLTYGAYELYEQQSAFGYVISKDPLPFTVDGTAKTVVVEMGNAPQKGILTLRKTGEVFQSVKQENGVYQPVYEVTGLAGAVYAMYADEDIKTPDGTLRYSYGELIERVETGPDGAAKFPAVYLGKYRVKEETAPFGFVLDPTVYHVEFTYAGQEVSVITEALDCYDQRQKVEISLAKTVEKDEIFRIGSSGEYENIRFGLFAAEPLIAADGKTIPKDGLIEEISLSDTLHGRFTADLPLGSYYVQETQTDGHYVLSDKKYPVIFEYAGQKKATVRLEVDDGNPIENKLKRGRLQGHKSDEDGIFLPGVVFGLFSPGTGTFTEETALVTATTASNGEFSFEDIPVGHWLLREISVPEGFILDETSHEVNISGDNQVITYDLTNFFIKGNVTLTKVDADYPENKLSGAVFAIYADSNGNKQFDPGDVKVGTLTEKAGVYSMDDLRYNGYFCVEEKAPEYFISDSTPRYFEIRTDGETVTLANRGGSIINRPQTGALKIVKTSEDGKISGIDFHVTGTALTGQSYDQTFTTDENGEIFIDDLRIGSYTVSEVGTENTVQYVLPDSQTVEIGYDETTTAEFYNRLKRGRVQGHKSDEDGLFLSGVVFGLFSPDTETFTEETALEVTTTAPNGDFSFERIPYGRYLLREIRAKKGFVLDETSHEVNITEDGQVITFDLTNFFIKGNVTLTKVDADYPGNKLSGAVFAIYADSNGNKQFDPGDVKIGTLTEENGVYGMENLRYNGYFCVEEKAPAYFMADRTPRYFEIRTDGETVTLANRGGCIINHPQTGALKIVKTSEDGKISGIEFRVTGTALTGQSYDQTFTTDENGEIFIDDLRIGSYTISEVGTENTVQYVLPADKVLTLTYGETVTAEFYNRLKRGTIYGEKQDEDGKPLAGVVFGLFPDGTEDFAMENAFATAQTFEDGTFIFKDIPYGKWLVAELETLPGYVLLKEPVTVEITEDGQKVTLDPIQNEHTKVEISKQDMTTGKELPGVKLQLFDEAGKLIEEWVSTDTPHLIERLPAGKYRLHEETAPDGYTVAEDVEFTVEETGEIQKVVMKDAPILAIPQTGFSDGRWLYALALILSLAALLLFVKISRRKKGKASRKGESC